MSGVMTVRWVYSRSKATRRAWEMGSEGLMERAAGGSRSSTVAWGVVVVSFGKDGGEEVEGKK